MTDAAPKILRVVNGYNIIDYQQNKNPLIRDAVIELWTRNGVLPGGEDPLSRADQVITAAINASHEVVGVVTVYKKTLSVPLLLSGKKVFVYRQFTQPADMSYALTHHLSVEAICLLDKTPGIDGLMITTQNMKMKREGFIRYFTRRGFEQISAPRMKVDVWYRDYSKL